MNVLESLSNTEKLTVISLVVTALTFLVTIASLYTARKSYELSELLFHKGDQSPWKIEALSSNDLRLDHIHLNVATLYGYRIVTTDPRTKKVSNQGKIQFFDTGTDEPLPFSGEASTIFKIPNNTTQIFLYYEEHKTAFQALLKTTHGDKPYYQGKLEEHTAKTIYEVTSLQRGKISLNLEISILSLLKNCKPKYIEILSKLSFSRRRKVAINWEIATILEYLSSSQRSSSEIDERIKCLKLAKRIKSWSTSVYQKKR